MWWGTGPEPGGSGGEDSKEPPQNQQLQDLQEQFEQQQTFIAQLKEMLRKTEQSSSVSREKVEEYASTLNEINARAKLSKIRRSEGRKNDPEASSSSSKTTTTSSKKSNVVTPAKEKINLLRQQLEENRVKLAARDKSQKDVEVMVNQMRAQLDESQAKINDPVVPIPKPETEIVTASFTMESSKDDLIFALKSKDDHIIELTAKVQQLQANVLDLQENIKEKDSVIDARTKAITLLSENLSKKGKDTLDMLDETKEQMRHMQQNFVALEAKMKNENIELQSELNEKENRIQELIELNSTLENNNSELNEKLAILSNNYTESENKILELNKLNEELQNKVQEFEKSTSEEKESSPQKTSKRKGNKKSKSRDTSEPKIESTQTPESVHVTRISELEKMVEELNKELEEYKSSETNSDDIQKLNKQLEEMNKNMIKMKAQHKAKLKELQKKLTPGEIGEKITNLESNNVKLEQRVAELEEEKGNLQLKLVDFESNKEKEYIGDLENKIEEQKMEIENHIRTITSLESQITMSSNELSSLRSELASMMHIENAQVCSEITSVQLEEQLDKEVSQKKEIQDNYNAIVKENENLLEKIELLNKEKQDLSAKLDQYMQENIDLIDRLEKLSAEKVSSAESIEIVDALTQQEKLEIEAYQKNLDFTDSDKPVDLEQNQDINESVSKLNEETSELMEKIKLFTDERREVMEKMDNLSAENQQLNSKLAKYKKEKTELDEKYQQLCKEKDSLISELNILKSQEESNDQSLEKIQEYRAIIENQKLQITSLQEELWNKSDNEAEKSSDNFKELNESLNSQLRTLQTEYESLYKEHECMRKENEELINNKIKELEKNIKEKEEKLKHQVETCSELQSEAEQLNRTIAQLNMELERKEQSHNETVTSLSSQLSELKIVIAENFEQLQQYEEEMNKNSQNTEELNDKLDELNYKIVDTEHIIEIKNVEISSLKQEKTAYETKIKNLENELKEKKDNFTETCRQLKEKCKFLENQIEANSGSIDDIKVPFEAKIAELEHKNKEQVEKMKKIAANLKKKSNMCQELESKLTEIKEKWENESKEKDEKQKIIDEQQSRIIEHQNKIDYLVIQLQEVENELSNVQLNLEDKNKEIEKIKQEYETKLKVLYDEKKILDNKLLDFKFINSERERLHQELIQQTTIQQNLQREIEARNQQIQNLTLEFNMIKSESEEGNKQMIQNLMDQLETAKINHETTQNAMDAKLQEKDLFIENIEAENLKYKERIVKLEEGLSNIEERRQQLEEKALDLKIQLEEKSSVCEEVSQSEDLLERRLSALLAHDEIIGQKLEQTTYENQSLTENVKTLTEENDSLQFKLNEIKTKLQESSQDNARIQTLESEVERLATIISSLENEVKKTHLEYETKLSEKNNEIENMEAELNSQLEQLHAERKNLLNQCEILQDNAKEYADNYQMLTDELDQLKDTLTKTQQHLDETIFENQRLVQNNEINLAKMIESENTLPNTSAEENANLKIEIDRLQNIISQKDVDIQNYQRQNNEMNLAKMIESENIVPNTSAEENTNLRIEIDRLQNIISQKDVDIQNYQRQNMQLQMSNVDSRPFAINEPQNYPKPDIFSTFTSPVIEKHEKSDQGLSGSEIIETPEMQPPPINEPSSSLENIDFKDVDSESMVHLINKEAKKFKKALDAARKSAQKHNVSSVQEQPDMEAVFKKGDIMVSNLRKILKQSEASHLRKLAERGVDEIISTAEKTVRNKPISEEFSNKAVYEEMFKKHSQSSFAKQSVNSSKIDLLRKIKALEFMLYNMEKEKDDTLAQCHELTNELARLIYEREKFVRNIPEKPHPDMQTLESQIVSSSEVDNASRNLRYSGFPPMDVQINKDSIQPSYLSYSENQNDPPMFHWGTEDSKIQESINSQIVQVDATKITPEDKKQFELMQYGQVDWPQNIQGQTNPVSENIPDPKFAYLCYQDQNQPPMFNWGSEDPKIQESINSQIVQVDATKITPEDRKQFELMQYGQVNWPQNIQGQTNPVNENIPDPKHVYLCYQDPNYPPTQVEAVGWGTEDPRMQEFIDSQIVQADATKITPEDRKQFELMQYGQVKMPKIDQNQTIPISDCIPDPKQSYLCYPEPRNIVEDTFASEEDGWGWSAEEAKLEAEHRASLSTAPHKIEKLEERIHDLEVERERLLEEIKSSQVRSGKLIKKLKLMKEKNDNLEAEVKKKSSGDFCDLELTIQDELNSQVQNLEKKIKELTDENSKDKAERENLLKKLEVITNANDRMIEMKEKQDNEIQFLNFKNRELSAKLEQLEWGDDSPNKSKTPEKSSLSSDKNTDEQKKHEDLAKKIAELNSIINDLTLDNEEMQCMLEEQRNMRLQAEKALSNRPVPENMKSEQEYLKVESENRNLHEELTKLNDVQQALENKFLKTENENKNLQGELIKLNEVQQVIENKFIQAESENKNLQEEIKQLEELRQSLQNNISEYIKSNNELLEKSNNLQLKVENLVQENNQYSVKIHQLQNENTGLQNQLTNMNIERESILSNQIDPLQITQLQNENLQLQNQLTNLNIEKENLLRSQMDANQFEINQLKSEITRLEEEVRRLENLLLEKEQNLQNFSAKIQQLELEKSSVEIRLQEILNIQNADKTNDEKLQQMNEQLMTALTNIDNKNKEISELNDVLSNERVEFDKKLSLTIDQLNQQWSERVDERGNDVAESWKLHLESVQNEFSQKEENLRAELNNIFKQNEELLSQNTTLQQQIQTVLIEKQTFVSDNNSTIESLQQCVNNKQTEIAELLVNVKSKEEEILKISQNLSNKELEFINLSQNIQSQNIEILQLSENVKNKESEILELAQKLQESSAELQLKNNEIINLQLTFEQMQSKENEYQNYIQQYSQQLEERTVQCNELQEKLNELNSFSQEEQKEISDLKKMIENQVLKIEDLKKEIVEKDSEYNALVAEFEKFEASFLRPEEKKEISEKTSKDELEPESKAKLDFALYMLHQRDVRCEELTVELMQLLEERDTLQLKLSNAIRLNEELRMKFSEQLPKEIQKQESPKPVKSTGAIPKSKSTAIVLGATGTELATEATENISAEEPQNADELTNKLSQLHTIGYNRDKTLKDDQESRHIQQMNIMQQHSDLAAKLPPEAAARLVDASYTVSREVQSPSNVLLNWLWGRSTPKVNDV